MEHASPRERGLSLPTKILLGLILGAALGVTLNLLYAPELGAPKSATYVGIEWWADRIVKPVGDVFLRLLFMVVVPVVFCSLFLGVAGLGSVQKLGNLGARTLGWFLGTTALAASLGILLVATIQPAKQIDPASADRVKAQYLGQAQEKIVQGKGASASLSADDVLRLVAGLPAERPLDAASLKAAKTTYLRETEKALEGQSKSWVEMLVEIVPDNVVGAAADNKKLLGLIFFALILGAASTRLPPDRTRVLREVLETIYELAVKVLGWAMHLAPLGVACLIFHSTAKLGIDVMRLVGWYFATAMGGLVVYQVVVVTGLAWVFAGLSPGRFYRGCRTLILTAFSTSSSNATMPTTIRTAVDEFGAPKEVAGFVMPLGATMNMNGTALFEGVSVLFLAQAAGIDLSIGQQVTVVGLAVLTAIGAAGVPGGSLPLLAIVLTQVGVPPEMLALILGVDRLVDMTRTIPNVTSDLVCSLWLARREGHLLKA
ncbi:MAG: dicarboxylate/amino acid:cation symporter [Planctomycetes bacterium]|nr:dicarboxylate/amino acid:cation symporter [Planctomycetota bacterium]